MKITSKKGSDFQEVFKVFEHQNQRIIRFSSNPDDKTHVATSVDGEGRLKRGRPAERLTPIRVGRWFRRDALIGQDVPQRFVRGNEFYVGRLCCDRVRLADLWFVGLRRLLVVRFVTTARDMPRQRSCDAARHNRIKKFVI